MHRPHLYAKFREGREPTGGHDHARRLPLLPTRDGTAVPDRRGIATVAFLRHTAVVAASAAAGGFAFGMLG